jgi:hypothetical protein
MARHVPLSVPLSSDCEFINPLGNLHSAFTIAILSRLQSLQEILPKDFTTDKGSPFQMTLQAIKECCTCQGCAAKNPSPANFRQQSVVQDDGIFLVLKAKHR